MVGAFFTEMGGLPWELASLSLSHTHTPSFLPTVHLGLIPPEVTADTVTLGFLPMGLSAEIKLTFL